MLLKPGDILLWRIAPGASWFDRLIGWGERKLAQTNSETVNYYHCAFVGPGVFKLYQSRPPRITNDDMPISLADNVEVYRLKDGLTDNQLKLIFTYANSQLGKWYNFLGLLTGGFIQVGTLSYCSQFTWQAYTYAGIVLCPWESLESPDDIAASSLLTRIR